jgi:hypothetical protein
MTKKYLIGLAAVAVIAVGFLSIKSFTQIPNSNLGATAIGQLPPGSTSFALVAPNGGQVYTPGENIIVAWHSSSETATTYTISLLGYVNGVEKYNSVLKQVTQTTDQTGVTLPTTIAGNVVPFGNNFKILIVDSTSQSLSASNFSIQPLVVTPPPVITPPIVVTAACNATSAPYITLLSPNGGESYVAGQQVTVNWKTCNIPASNPMFITIQGDATVNGGLGVNLSLLNNGTYTFNLPTQSSWKYLIYGDHYYMRVGSNNPSIVAGVDSATPFSINQ